MRDSGLRFFRSLARGAIDHPGRALGIAALLTLAAAPGIRWLKLRADGHALLSQSAPEVVYDKSLREQFGLQDTIVTLVSSHDPHGIFNRATLELTRDLTVEFQRLPGIDPSNVLSLATEPGFRYRPGSRAELGLIGPALTNQDGLGQLREDLKGIEIYTGTLVSMDGKCAAILIGIPSGADCGPLYQGILEIVARHHGGPDEIGVTGAPVAESLLGIQILQDLGVPRAWLGAGAGSVALRETGEQAGGWLHVPLRVARRVGLVPLAALVMMLTLLACFRNAVAALLPLPGVGAALLFVFGCMGWSGTPIYLTHGRHAGIVDCPVGDKRHLFVQPVFRAGPRAARGGPRGIVEGNIRLAGLAGGLHGADGGGGLPFVRILAAGSGAGVWHFHGSGGAVRFVLFTDSGPGVAGADPSSLAVIAARDAGNGGGFAAGGWVHQAGRIGGAAAAVDRWRGAGGHARGTVGRMAAGSAG